ncbi:hypothetical protein P8C59_005322 [Phyllachora maydis]|uniref:UDENN domain-containing protein n=1 Tax=Phyllachora maydis TaxID=1825666 RepID=A0AAD9MDD4_9PEZI|nr:hypothetical protein P8C59_005322 [Phyllachora maydis]
MRPTKSQVEIPKTQSQDFVQPQLESDYEIGRGPRSEFSRRPLRTWHAMDNSTTTPLADYFWIAGIEHVSYDDGFSNTDSVEDTIAEDGEDELVDTSLISSPKSSARHSRQNSGHRFSKLSINAGFVMPTRAAQGEVLFDDFDFDQALLKFAEQRESFLDDLSFTAGAKLQSRPPMTDPRTEKLKDEELEPTERRSPIMKSIRGSLRRKMSFRDLNSVRKQAQAPRTASIRTAKRMSNYNSVIPTPEPLNTEPDMHPLKRRFEPVLLDRYPPRDAAKDDLARRGKFPDYVPMFAFPNDIQVVSSDDRPRSTWHGFTMTSEDNSKIHGITIIIWTALSAEVADKVEKRCEQWRQRHMTNEERELAASLGLRLAAERAGLSQLLAKLPTIQSGSAAREALDDQISAVEEKIALMADMLRPLRHGAASKIDGLTAGETGLWAPRAFGILGRDATKMGFWKEWLRAVVVPMTDGAILRVPASSPRVGRWQPLERYVVNLCTEAFSPLSSKTQVELGVRELRLYARTEAENELPGCRNTDIFALFRCLSLDNIVLLYEYALSESRIIFLSSHTAMLHLACHALISLLYPLSWASVFIPVLPARLLSALEAPCPYIVGVEKRYERIDLPEDDYVVVDLDKDAIDATSPPQHLPRTHRRKLVSLLQVAAPHKLRFGVPSGPPPYAMESFPYDAYSAENGSLFSATTPASSLGKWVTQNSSSFAEPLPPTAVEEYATMLKDTQAFNEFIHERERNPATHPTLRLFDEIILAKKARGRPSTLTAKVPGYLSDRTEHIWRTASVPVPSAKFPGDYRAVVTRIPTRLDPALMKEPRAIQGVPRAEQGRTRGLVRKQVPSMFGLPTPELDVS